MYRAFLFLLLILYKVLFNKEQAKSNKRLQFIKVFNYIYLTKKP